jgi:hypothetical protein
MNMDALKQSIFTKLSTYVSDLWEEGAVGETTSNPYGVFSMATTIDGLNNDNDCRQATVHLDLYYRTFDKILKPLDDVADTVENGVQSDPFVSSNGFAFDMKQPVRQSGLPTSDEGMYRMRISWTVQYFETN